MRRLSREPLYKQYVLRRLIQKLPDSKRAMSGLRIAALTLALLALPLPGPVLAGDFEDGMQFVLAKDYAKAVESFKKAAAQGNADAQFNLGVLYSRGRGVTQDYEQAANWFRKAAEQGDVPAQSMLGFIYLKGQGVRQDYQQAMFWYLRA